MSKLKELRLKNKLTQRELAEIIGVTPDYISQIERGRTPGMDTAIKIADLFGMTIDEIFFNKRPNLKFSEIKEQSA